MNVHIDNIYIYIYVYILIHYICVVYSACAVSKPAARAIDRRS